jgi:hypothetical protein
VNQALSERLKYYIEIFRLVWASLLLTGGGVVSLLLRERNTVTIALAIAGGVLMVVMAFALFLLDNRIRKSLHRMEEQKNG